MSESGGPGVVDRLVDLLARGMDALGLNGTRLRWRRNQRRRDLGEAGLRAQMFVRSARTPVKMCPQCRDLVPRSAWTCPACGAGLSRVRAPGLTRIVANLIPGATAATVVILFINTALFAVMLLVPPAVPDAELPGGFQRLWSFDGYTLLRYGGGIPMLTFGAGEWWRLVTPLFLHAGLLHFAMNSWALVQLGPLAEEEYGTERFAAIYFLSGLAGTILAQYVGGVQTVGASGAICGLLGLLLVHGWRRGGAYGQSLRNAMLQNTLLMLVISFGWSSVIDWRSHVGGFLAGAVCGLVVSPGNLRGRAAVIGWNAAAFAIVVVVLIAFYLMASQGAETLRLVIQSRPSNTSPYPAPPEATMTTIPPFNQYLGVQVVKMDQGVAEAVLDLGPHHLNGRGVVHGGVMSAVLDTVMGAAVISAIPKEWWCATTSLTVQFLEGGREGRISASAHVVRRGKRVAFVQGDVRDASGRLLATAAGSWHLWPHRPEVSQAPSIAAVTVRGTGERLRVGKIVAVGRNYADHIREMGGDGAEPPVLFLKPPSALVAGGGTIQLPEGLGEIHHEVELVVVIGRGGRSIPEERALDHVFGYAVGFDLTLRGIQSEAKRKGEPWALSKGFDGSAPVSLVAPRDEVGDGSGLAIAASVNGTVRQQDTTSKMIHGVPALVAFASRLMTLERGDLLFTGTPAGVGPIVPGDVAVGEIEKVGTLTVQIAPAP